jgi:hypothetical protein
MPHCFAPKEVGDPLPRDSAGSEGRGERRRRVGLHRRSEATAEDRAIVRGGPVSAGLGAMTSTLNALGSPGPPRPSLARVSSWVSVRSFPPWPARNSTAGPEPSAGEGVTRRPRASSAVTRACMMGSARARLGRDTRSSRHAGLLRWGSPSGPGSAHPKAALINKVINPSRPIDMMAEYGAGRAAAAAEARGGVAAVG